MGAKILQWRYSDWDAVQYIVSTLQQWHLSLITIKELVPLGPAEAGQLRRFSDAWQWYPTWECMRHNMWTIFVTILSWLQYSLLYKLSYKLICLLSLTQYHHHVYCLWVKWIIDEIIIDWFVLRAGIHRCCAAGVAPGNSECLLTIFF